MRTLREAGKREKEANWSYYMYLRRDIQTRQTSLASAIRSDVLRVSKTIDGFFEVMAQY